MYPIRRWAAILLTLLHLGNWEPIDDYHRMKPEVEVKQSDTSH